MSPKPDNNSNSNCPPTGHPPGSDINVKEFELTKELFDKVMVLDNSSFDANKVDLEEHVPFDSNDYPDGANTSLYMRPPPLPPPPPRNHTTNRKHKKKKGSYFQKTKPNKLKLILPLPDFRLYSVHHLVKYDREQSCADKSSAGSNHTSIIRHHNVCHFNPTIFTRQSAGKIKKKRGGVMNSASVSI